MMYLTFYANQFCSYLEKVVSISKYGLSGSCRPGVSLHTLWVIGSFDPYISRGTYKKGMKEKNLKYDSLKSLRQLCENIFSFNGKYSLCLI